MRSAPHSIIGTVRHAVAMLGAVVLLAGLGVSVASGTAHAASGTGAITGYEGLCLDDRAASTAEYNPIQVYTCNGTDAQQWTVESNDTLEVLGMCLDVDAAGTTNGTLVDLYTCNGTGAQTWEPQSNGELINPNSGKCLDDTGWGGSGTQVQIWACADTANQQWNLPNGGSSSGNGSFVVSQAQFNEMFPNANSFYSYSGLVSAMSLYPAFATTGGTTVELQEAAAFLANVDHETGGLVYINEVDQSGDYCDTSESYGCPAGTYAYYGRGPLQISWNFNYEAAGQAIGQDLLDNPDLVATNSAISWETALWYWMTQTGPGTMTAHNAMVTGAGFGQTIWAINGSVECNGGDPAEMQDRVNDYESFTSILGVSPGNNLTC
jgi:hypothetical protein